MTRFSLNCVSALVGEELRWIWAELENWAGLQTLQAADWCFCPYIFYVSYLLYRCQFINNDADAAFVIFHTHTRMPTHALTHAHMQKYSAEARAKDFVSYVLPKVFGFAELIEEPHHYDKMLIK